MHINQHYLTHPTNTTSVCGRDMVGRRNSRADSNPAVTTCPACLRTVEYVQARSSSLGAEPDAREEVIARFPYSLRVLGDLAKLSEAELVDRVLDLLDMGVTHDMDEAFSLVMSVELSLIVPTVLPAIAQRQRDVASRRQLRSIADGRRRAMLSREGRA